MILKEKVETIMQDVKSKMEPEKGLITLCRYKGKRCNVVCATLAAKIVHETDIPCTAMEYKEFAKSCKNDKKWDVHKLIFWIGAYCYCINGADK